MQNNNEFKKNESSKIMGPLNNRVPIPNKNGGIFYENRLLSSRAYWELNGSEKNILNAFMLKRQLIDQKTAKKLSTYQI